MERDAFNRRIEAVEKRLGALTEEQRKDSDGLWDELSAALGELRAAGEVLHRKPESGESQMANGLLRSLLDVLPAGIIICDGGGTILMNNPAAEAILGSIVVGDVHHPKRAYSLHGLDGTPFPAKDVPLVRALENGEITRDVEILIRRADGDERVVVAGAAPVRDKAGHVISGVAVFQDITRYKRAEEAVENLARFPSENPNPVIRVMEDGTIYYANHGAQCLLDEWGTRVGQHLPDEWQTLVAEAFEAGLGRAAETFCSGRTFTFTIVPVKDADYVNLYGTDITERVRSEQERAQAEQELRVALEKYRVLFEAFPLGITISGRTGNILESNREAERLLGIPQVEHERRSIDDPEWQIIRPDGSPMPAEEYASVRALQEGRLIDNVEMGIVKESGDVTWINVTAAPIPLENYGVAVAYGDITEHRQVREERERLSAALDRERRTLQAIMENTPTHLAYLDSQFNFVLVNPAYAEGAGYTGEQLVGYGHFELFPDEGNQAIFERVRGTGEPVKFVAKPFEFPDRPELGITYWDWTLAPVKDADGQMLGLVLSLVDVTEQEQTRQKLRRYADRLRVLHETDQAVLAARSLDEIAESALDCVPQLLEGCMWASIALYDLEREEVSLLAVHTVGQTSMGKGWRGSMEPSWALEFDALAQGEPQVIEDLQMVPATSFVVETLQAEGIRAHVTVPLVVEGKLIGSLDLGMRKPGCLTAGQMEVAVELADELAVGIQQTRLNEQVRQHAEELENLVTQRTRALRDREARLRAIFEGAGIGIAVLGVEGRVEESNPVLQELLGYSAKEFRGKLLTDFSHPDDVMADETFYKELMAQKKGVGRYRTERRYVRRDGRLCWASVTASLVREGRRKPQFVIVMMEDITEQRQAQEALIQAEKLTITGRLAASLAHEINNPLQSVIGCLGLAQESLEVDEKEDARDLLRIAAEELERAAGIVSDLRDLNRPSDPDDRKPVDVNLQMEHILMLTKEQFQKRGVEVEWEPADRLPALIMVPDRMSQVFLNLALNALEAMPDGGRLRIGTDCASDPAWVRVTFADTGCGIAPEAIPHLFDPFYTTKANGLGLGLYITHNVVEEHGGRIEVESLLGKGTTFTVWLPVPEDDDEGES
jgi:PAS domain S-box-containing protein